MKRTLTAAALTGVGIFSVAAGAQESASLEEVVVTATKREATLQDVPVAVSVATAETLKEARILDLIELQTVVPSLRVSQLQTSTQTNFIIRGFGNGANNPGIESSVGLFIDGVYRSRSAAAIGDFMDVERVEVLRGPQSTLFGQNASAGVISVTTRKPQFTTSGSVEIGFGDLNQKLARGYLTGPIGEKVAYSISAGLNQRDGYFKNLADGSEINDRDRTDFRLQLLANVSDSLSLRLLADYSQIDELCCGVVNLLNGPTGALVQALGGRVYTGNRFDDSAYLNKNPRNDVDNKGVALHVDWKGESWSLTSITATRRQDAFFDYDTDFTSADLVPTNINDQEVRTLTQELRLNFDNGGPLTGVLGGYYLDEEVKYRSDIRFGPAFRGYATGLVAATGGSPATFNQLEGLLGLPAGTFFRSGTGSLVDTAQQNDAYTLFGQLDWKLTDRLTFTGGVAFTNSDKDVSLTQTNTDAFGQVNLVQLGFGSAFQALTGLPPTPANIANPMLAAAAAAADAISVTPCTAASPPPACNSALALYPLQFLFPVTPFDDGRSSDSKTTYTARLAFDVNDNVKVYGGVSTGFKATSWNLSRDSRPFPPAGGTDRSPLGTRPNPYYARYGTRFAGPEESTVLELGLKARWERAALYVAVFDQEIKGFQSNIFFGTGFVLANAGKQSTTGIEIETQFAVTPALTLELGGTFLDPKYDSFKNAQGLLPNGQAGTVDLSGATPAGIHETSIVAALNYRYSLGSFDGVLRADYRYDDNVQVVDNVPAAFASRKVGELNASVSIERNGWEVQLWARNLNDDRYLVSAFPTVAQQGSLSGYTNQPRQIGATLRKSF
jgi:iron complex outermembrane receptor protein